MTSSSDRYIPKGDLILVLNSGSSSIKFALFDAGQSPMPRKPVWNGKVQGIGNKTRTTFGETGVTPYEVTLDPKAPYHSALELIEKQVRLRLNGRRLYAISHRVVHGGMKYFKPIRVTEEVVADLRSYIPLAPLHQPFALEAMEILLKDRPDLLQVACFDTGFHHTMPRVEQMLAIPHEAWEYGLRRYGFHGLSYDYMTTALPERLGEEARGKVIVAHLGSGASMCAMQDLKSVSTTMGFSALDGLMMGTRCGSLDPGALIYLMQIEKLTLEQVGKMLYYQSGLLGVSGVSADLPDLFPLEAQEDVVGERVRDALALYVRSIVRKIGELTAVLNGLDVLVFTAGIGEHSSELRRRVCHQLGWLGVKLDEQANDNNDPIISSPDSKVKIVVEFTNEEWVAANKAKEVVAAVIA